MKIYEIIEGRIKNTYSAFDQLRGNEIIAREIRQTYNKCVRGRLKNPLVKKFTRHWAESIINNPEVTINSQLVEMLSEIIRLCS
jgi:RecB family endonuclease NucS